MPARYFPFTQDFNSDAEGWELSDTFGDRSVRIWMEVLSIVDREKNNWKQVEGWDSVIARKVRQTPATIRSVVGWMLAKHWLAIRQQSANGSLAVLYAPNYAKFHKIAAEASLPPNLPNLPNLPDPEILKKESARPARPAASPDSPKPKTLDPRIKEIADKIYSLDKVKFARLIVWIKQAEKEGFDSECITAALTRFQPYAQSVSNWYPYLDKLIYKTDQDLNRDEHEAAHNARKEDLRDLSKSRIFSLVKGLADAKKS